MSEQFRRRNPALLIGRNYINGEWLECCSGNTFEVHVALQWVFNSEHVSLTETNIISQTQQPASLLERARSQPFEMWKMLLTLQPELSLCGATVPVANVPAS